MAIGAVFLIVLIYYARGGDAASSFDPDSPLSSLKSTTALNGDRHIYAAMLDAGSTGSRIHIYHFAKSEQGILRLIDEYFKENQPGIGAFANNSEKAGEKIQALLDSGMPKIPKGQVSSCLINLFATAGLRRLPEKQSNALLDTVCKYCGQHIISIREVIKKSPFKKPKSYVSILSGDNEGIYAWQTLNFLTGTLNSSNTEASYGTLDLGGASTQLTFAAIDEKTLKKFKEDIKTDEVLEQKFRLFTKSYKDMGLKVARVKVLAANPKSKDGKFVTACSPSGAKFSWKDFGVENNVSNPSDEKYGFEECMKEVKNYPKTDKIEELKVRKAYAFSYYYDIAVDLHLIGAKGGEIDIQKFYDAAKIECNKPKRDHDMLCFDSVYIINLLTEGFGLDLQSKLTIGKKINEFELCWALGATLEMLGE
ncbi:uncharacterized protein TRIADDRAFT_61888 [Trichoplax adhaerens]|uniref:Ectonucleoside triphosphate diphosphohydrolase 5 n=1 Tax=Trichoplax adhaerens TaxID=10228 RepID=B3SC91_TRIAD|nr:hypothetical protein TRIADDRAFT_61888 [Trichoplax adhaerens]EDV19620.1 hypothetical protein TRIADDRAFT_61888 [Trichoplax adhaerens]|eukprot:XP_002117858.1 hypothetical protein TRIADDRAFT_61888 [Trichoplax adhaerens]